MAKVNLGRVSVESYVMEKPVGISSTGAFIYPGEIKDAKAAAALNLPRLTLQNKIRLVTERLRVEPEFEIGVLSNAGAYAKNEVLRHVSEQTPFGKQLMEMELQYIPYFLNQVLGIEETIPVFRTRKPGTPSEKDDDTDSDSAQPDARIKTSVLFCENTTDKLTSLAATYRKKYVHPAFAAKGYNVISLEGTNDVRAQFAMQAKSSTVVYISGVGHGGYQEYTGHDFDTILQVGNYNTAETKGKIIHFLSCETARDLGPNTILKGAKAYIGYTEDLLFKVQTADLFWKCDSTFDICMANGCTAGDAIYDTYMQYITVGVSVIGTVTATLLFGDRNLLRSPSFGADWGSDSARIYTSKLSSVSNTEYAEMDAM